MARGQIRQENGLNRGREVLKGLPSFKGGKKGLGLGVIWIGDQRGFLMLSVRRKARKIIVFSRLLGHVRPFSQQVVLGVQVDITDRGGAFGHVVHQRTAHKPRLEARGMRGKEGR